MGRGRVSGERGREVEGRGGEVSAPYTNSVCVEMEVSCKQS